MKFWPPSAIVFTTAGRLSRREARKIRAAARELALIGARQRAQAESQLVKARARAMREAFGLPPSPALEG